MTVTLEQMCASFVKREGRRMQEADLRRERLRALLPAAATMLRETFGVGRILLFGSLATGERSEYPDVDFAVEGLPSARYFEAVAALMKLFAGPVDLVCLEGAGDSLARRIAADGKPL